MENFKLKGLDKYVVNTDNIDTAVSICIKNRIGVTTENLEEIDIEVSTCFTNCIADKHSLDQIKLELPNSGNKVYGSLFGDGDRSVQPKHEERIKLEDSGMEMIMKLCEGNPGAIQALMEMLDKGAAIDPDNAFGMASGLFSLDSIGIYGSDIYVLHSDICGKQVNKTLAVLRSCQLGIFSNDTLRDACSRQDYSGREMVPVEELYAKVKKQLLDFDKGGLDG